MAQTLQPYSSYRDGVANFGKRALSVYTIGSAHGVRKFILVTFLLELRTAHLKVARLMLFLHKRDCATLKGFMDKESDTL